MPGRTVSGCPTSSRDSHARAAANAVRRSGRSLRTRGWGPVSALWRDPGPLGHTGLELAEVPPEGALCAADKFTREN